MIYIIILFLNSILILEVAITGSLIIGSQISLNATIYMILFSVSISFLYIAINKDTLSKIEAELINKNKLYKVPRSLLKISISFLTGIFLMFIFLTIILIIPFETDITQETLLFFSELQNISSIFLRWEIQLLVIFSTIIPYILVYFANANWRSTSLTYSQWNSILNLIDPMGSLILAVLLVNEYFPIEILIITIFLLVIAIIIRHAHETKNLVQAILLINLEKGAMENIPVKLLKYNGIFQVNSITGTHDLILNVKTNNIREFYYLINNRLRTLSEIINIKILFINKIIELQP
ncbi:MAG: Lrp/AsnC ligand binding domain-containing protein [Promethearchaeota archaeon]